MLATCISRWLNPKCKFVMTYYYYFCWICELKEQESKKKLKVVNLSINFFICYIMIFTFQIDFIFLSFDEFMWDNFIRSLTMDINDSKTGMFPHLISQIFIQTNPTSFRNLFYPLCMCSLDFAKLIPKKCTLQR